MMTTSLSEQVRFHVGVGVPIPDLSDIFAPMRKAFDDLSASLFKGGQALERLAESIEKFVDSLPPHAVLIMRRRNGCYTSRLVLVPVKEWSDFKSKLKR